MPTGAGDTSDGGRTTRRPDNQGRSHRAPSPPCGGRLEGLLPALKTILAVVLCGGM